MTHMIVQVSSTVKAMLVKLSTAPVSSFAIGVKRARNVRSCSTTSRLSNRGMVSGNEIGDGTFQEVLRDCIAYLIPTAQSTG